MKIIILAFTVFSTGLIFTNCHTTKNTTTDTPKFTYEGNLKAVIAANCVPCHIPEKGGFKKAFDNYDSVRTDIDEIIRRIQLNPGEKGYMPFKKAKLSDSTIGIFKKFKEDGAMER
jgi:mono/diheme cytochrome c family protein